MFTSDVNEQNCWGIDTFSNTIFEVSILVYKLRHVFCIYVFIIF